MAEDSKNGFDEDYDEDMLEDMDLGEDQSLFWSLKVPTNNKVEIPEPTMPGYIVRVTKACFGPKVSKGSRSVVMCNNSEEEAKLSFIILLFYYFIIYFIIVSILLIVLFQFVY